MRGESAAGAEELAAGVSIAEYGAVHLPRIGWITIRQFRRDPDGAFFVSGTDAEGNRAEETLLPDGTLFRVR